MVEQYIEKDKEYKEDNVKKTNKTTWNKTKKTKEYKQNNTKKTKMSWNWVYGCCNCTPKEMAIVCGLSLLIFAVW